MPAHPHTLSVADQAAADALIGVRRLSLSERTGWTHTLACVLSSVQLAEEMAFPLLYEVTGRLSPPRLSPPPPLRVFDLEITVFSDQGDVLEDDFRVGSFLLDPTRQGAVQFQPSTALDHVASLLLREEEVAAMILRCLVTLAGVAHTPPHTRTSLMEGIRHSDESEEQGLARQFASSLFLLGWPPFCRLLSTLSVHAHEILSRLWSWDVRPYAAAHAQHPPSGGDPFVWDIHEMFLEVFTPLLPPGSLPPTRSSLAVAAPPPRRRAAT